MSELRKWVLFLAGKSEMSHCERCFLTSGFIHVGKELASRGARQLSSQRAGVLRELLAVRREGGSWPSPADSLETAPVQKPGGVWTVKLPQDGCGGPCCGRWPFFENWWPEAWESGERALEGEDLGLPEQGPHIGIQLCPASLQ